MASRLKLLPGGDVPPVTAARRMGLSLDAFSEALLELVSRGFPLAVETTGNFAPLLTPGAVAAINTIFPIAWTLAKAHQDRP